MWKRHSEKKSTRERDEESDCLSVMGSPVNSDDLNFKPVTPFVKRTEITDSATKTKTTVQTRLEQNLKIDVSDTESQEPHEKIATRKNRISKIPKKRKKTLSDTQSLKKLSFSKKACKTQQNPVKELGTNSVLQKEVLEYPTLPCSEDVNPTPGFEEENVKSQEITLDTELVRNKKSAGKAYKQVSSSQPVNFRNKSFRTPVFCEDAKYVSMLSAEFENSYQCEEESPHQRVSRPMRAIPSPNKNNNTELHMINFKKTVYNTTASAVSTESSHIGTIGSKPEPVIEPNWDYRTVDLQSLLNTCENLECRKRDIHQVPTESINLDSQRGQELCSAFIKHIPLLVELMWGRSKQISTHNRHVLIGQLLQAIRVVLNVDIGGAVAFLLHKATTCFHKHYKMINEILVNIRHKDCDNVMEVVDVLLSVGDFRWPLWFQIRVFTNMTKHETNFDYKALSRYLNTVLYNKLLIHFEKLEVGGMHVPINSKSSEFASTIKCSDGKSCIIPLPTKSVEDHMLLSKQTIDHNSKSSEFASTMYRTDGKSSTITTEQAHSRQSIHQQLVPIARGSQVAQQPNGCKQIAQQITENLVSKNVEKALTILNNCKAEQLYEVAHNIIIGHAAEYGRVVNVLMDYFKERRCMHLLMKNFDTFLSIVGFNLVVKLLKDEKKEEACNLFDQIINAGLEYLNVQVFTEILGGTENPSPMKNVLIAADLFLNSDNYDKAAKLLFDNCLVGDSCKWKGTTQLDIKLRNKCIESVFNVFIEDSRPAVTMLACQLFSEMQQQNCPFAFDEDRVIKVLRKLLSISALNKLTYDIFKKYFMTASDSSKSYLVIHGAPICRAMIVISHSCDPDFCPILLQEFLKLYVYPNWQILDGGTITVQTNWLTIEIQLLFEDFVQRLVALRSRKAFLGLALPKQIRVVLEESANEDAIMALNVDVSHDAAINRLQEIFFSLLPRVRTLLDNGQLITIREDWTNYFHEQYNKAKLGIN